jgi:fatty acid desaturase
MDTSKATEKLALRRHWVRGIEQGVPRSEVEPKKRKESFAANMFGVLWVLTMVGGIGFFIWWMGVLAWIFWRALLNQ